MRTIRRRRHNLHPAPLRRVKALSAKLLQQFIGLVGEIRKEPKRVPGVQQLRLAARNSQSVDDPPRVGDPAINPLALVGSQSVVEQLEHSDRRLPLYLLQQVSAGEPSRQTAENAVNVAS